MSKQLFKEKTTQTIETTTLRLKKGGKLEICKGFRASYPIYRVKHKLLNFSGNKCLIDTLQTAYKKLRNTQTQCEEEIKKSYESIQDLKDYIKQLEEKKYTVIGLHEEITSFLGKDES
jgi:hypothetical protein